ncbi:hypothetical protein PN612_02835 [Parabacteroides distasonis]|jgi:hypothetical protein|uniref:Uncharacterized protein n=1 Tax=Parabacteroides distasonis TaxID=823 RepID=A0AAW6F266_PARDI|nr:hypothetical protein [Parabacteroides distasonis]MDB9137443.1 hypothetical protein [Parabacteroides distasonis]MDB9142611.1 hypothetical protein [Parabacteroides distasonis]
MKKIITTSFLSSIFMYHTNAQTVVEGNKLLDNWSIGISAGGTTLLTHPPF